MSEKQTAGIQRETGRAGSGRRRFLWATVLGAGLATALTVAASAYPHGGPGMDPMGGGHRNPQAMRERVEFKVDWLLTKVDATDNQKQEIKRIAEKAFEELAPLRERRRANRRAFMEALSAPSVDRARLDQIREERLAIADSVSRITTDAIAQAASALTAEQRGKLLAMHAGRFKDRRHDGDRPEGEQRSRP